MFSLRRLLDYAVLCGLIAAIVFGLRYFDLNDSTGGGRVIDGDSLMLDGQKVRLYGIDAPELSQMCTDRSGVSYRCGHKARQFLKSLVGNALITCSVIDVDRYYRDVSICKVGDNELNLKMLQSGWAISYFSPSLRYVRAEKSARRDKRGLWQGAFERPSEWRDGHR